MNMEERQDYLRKHGIEIETPEDRRNAEASKQTSQDSLLHQISNLTMSGDGKINTDDVLEFCMIPQDTSKPIQSLYLPKTFASDVGGDALPTYVKPFFADSRAVDTKLMQDQANKHLSTGSFKDMDMSKVSASAMNAVAAQGSVETFPLVRPADTNQYHGVYIYLDEMGMLKKLLPNSRASSIAAACGYNPAPIFYGDIFVGRVRTRPTMANVPFVAGQDTNPGADWMRRATAENLAWQQTANEITAKKNPEQPAIAGTDGKAATEDKFDWTQDDEEVEISVHFDEPIKKNAVKVKFMPKSIKITYNAKDHLQVNLYSSVDVDGCTWTVEKDRLVITAEKASPGPWPRIQIS